MVSSPSLFHKFLRFILIHYVGGCIFFSQDSFALMKNTLWVWGHREPRRLPKGFQTPVLVKTQWKCLNTVGIHRSALTTCVSERRPCSKEPPQPTLSHPGGVLYLQDSPWYTAAERCWGSVYLNGQFVAISSHSTSISSLFSHYLLITLQLQDVVKIILHFSNSKSLSARDACRAVEMEIFCMIQ